MIMRSSSEFNSRVDQPSSIYTSLHFHACAYFLVIVYFLKFSFFLLWVVEATICLLQSSKEPSLFLEDLFIEHKAECLNLAKLRLNLAIYTVLVVSNN